MESIMIRKSVYDAVLSGENGALVSFVHKAAGNRKEILRKETNDALFVLRILRDDGSFSILSDRDAVCRVIRQEDQISVIADRFSGFPGLGVTVRIDAEEQGLAYTADIENGTAHYIESFFCPCVYVSSKLRDNGGKGSIFSPREEGMLIHDARRIRALPVSGTNARDLTDTFYPGYISMQYMAYLEGEAGLYVAAHDTAGIPKVIWPQPTDSGIWLCIGAFPCVAPEQSWRQPYPVVVRPVGGTWTDAAEEYRQFLESGSFPLPPKLRSNPKIPDWVYASPLEIVYPPRSVRGTGYMGPNEFFPYVQAVKYLDDLSEETESSVMALLPYWEGSAPWAPPFVWPPYGGEDMFDEFVEKMHASRHYVGLYCSGLHWTEHHNLVPEYDMTRYREVHGLTDAMCLYPDGAFIERPAGNIRTGFTMCCSCRQTRDIAMDQCQHILDAQVDYIQYFDQHHGGMAYPCYSKNHRHPPCFGVWNTHAMKALYSGMNHLEAKNTGRHPVIGTEAGAADYYCGELYLNDLRWQSNLPMGEIVPAYSYVLHEYTVNYMGNQAGVDNWIERAANPDSILFALAFSFISGNALTLVLKSGGEIHYDWGLSWLHPGPRQAPVKKLTRNLNAMRRGPANRFLIGGRMLPTPAFSQPGTFEMTRRDGSTYACGEVLSSCWQDENGEVIQLFANFRHRDIEIGMSETPLSAFDEKGDPVPVNGSKATVPALGCLAVRIR